MSFPRASFLQAHSRDLWRLVSVGDMGTSEKLSHTSELEFGEDDGRRSQSLGKEKAAPTFSVPGAGEERTSRCLGVCAWRGEKLLTTFPRMMRSVSVSVSSFGVQTVAIGTRLTVVGRLLFWNQTETALSSL